MQSLSAFQNQLPILTVYACMAYMALLAMIDPWAPLQPQSLGQELGLLLMCAADLCGYLLALYLMRSIRREHQAVSESHELATLLALSQQYYGSLVEGVEQERILRHDFVHHLRVMEALHTAGKGEELQVYLAELLGQTEAKAPGRWCACYVANVLLEHFSNQAREVGIACDFDAVIPEWDAQESPKLCVVLGNLLQNALEACQRMPKGQPRFIFLLARVVNGNLTIEVRNSFDGVLQTKEGRLFSRKQSQGHGLGLSSVRSVLESSGGYFETSHSGNVFVAQAALKVPEQTERTVDFNDKNVVF